MVIAHLLYLRKTPYKHFHLAFTDSPIIFFPFYRQGNWGLDRPVKHIIQDHSYWMVVPGFTPRAIGLQNSCSLVCSVHIIISRFYQRCVFTDNNNLKEASFPRLPVGGVFQASLSQGITGEPIRFHVKPAHLSEKKQQCQALTLWRPVEEARRCVCEVQTGVCPIMGGYFAFLRLTPRRNLPFQGNFLQHITA